MADEIEEQLATAELLATFQSRLLKAPKDKRTSGWLKTNLESLEILWKEFHKRHLPISRNSDLQEHEYLRTSTYDTAHNHYIDVKTLILNALSPGRNQSTVEADQEYTRVTFDAPYKTKLPTLDLPKFSGKQVEWEAYKEMFIALVHNVSTISPVFKLQYLISSLTGDAAKRLKNTQIKAANYNGAWETMLKRYDNIRVNLFAHMKSIVSCPPVSRKFETEISRVLDVMLEAQHGFANLEFPVKHWGAWLVFQTLQKLDGTTREDWERHLGDQDEFPKFSELVTYLEIYVCALETAHASEDASKHHAAIQVTRPKTPKSMQVRVASMDTAGKTIRPKVRTCACCKEQHNISNCESYRSMAVPQRRTLVLSQKLCENCLKPNHSFTDCRAPGRCFNCGQKHHTSLHAAHQLSSPAPISKETHRREPTAPGSALKQNVVTSMHTQPTRQQILLATAIVELHNGEGDYPRSSAARSRLRIFFCY